MVKVLHFEKKIFAIILTANTLKIYFHFPENEGNRNQGTKMSFDIVAEAVQTKNNPNKLFN